jgi:hypothetical protein
MTEPGNCYALQPWTGKIAGESPLREAVHRRLILTGTVSENDCAPENWFRQATSGPSFFTKATGTIRRILGKVSCVVTSS